MMYFRPTNLSELRVISRMLNIAMVDFVGAALDAYIFKKVNEKGSDIPARQKKRYVGPRNDTSEKRIRYVMRLDKNLVEKIRDIASHDNRRFTHVCDEAISDFIAFTKLSKNFKNIWTSRSDVEAVRGRKSVKSVEEIAGLLSAYKKNTNTAAG
jgi:predicted transcriptional regulator